MTRATLRRRVALGLGLLALPLALLVLCSLCEPLPAALSGQNALSVRVTDRNGQLIRQVRATDGQLSERVSLDALSPWVVPALLAAEDARFYRHPGVDPLAMLRAAFDSLRQGRVVSGASTLTQQLARALFKRPRSAAGKWRELSVALRLEASLSKRQILEEYLNRVEFGPNVRGIQSASEHYFDKPVRDLDLAEAALLVAIPRGPALYDPERGLDRVLRRRNRVLSRMQERGLATAEAVLLARSEPVRLERRTVNGGNEHLLRGLLSGGLAPELRGATLQGLETTVDLPLQREVETLARRAADYVAGYGASALSVIVVDNASGDVLAYLGSPDFASVEALGQNDGARALRQPGSALKPFVYAAAMERSHFTASTLLPDLPLELETSHGAYQPKNYDGRFHGPVRLRRALANSLNVPAVYTADRVGPAHVLSALHNAGFASLTGDADQYGAALALGDGEVRLSELAAAYAMLARDGELLPLRLYRRASLASGASLTRDDASPVRAIDARVVRVLTDILTDDLARSAEFGTNGPLAFAFPVAAKTGTSKGYRDNWTIGYTREVTVAVWAGNFDGRPMTGSSGITGAAPLFHEVMLAAMRGRSPAPLVSHAGLVEAQVCELSGKLASALCPHRQREWFLPESVPTAACDMHEAVAIEPHDGLRAGPRCPGAEPKVFERYPSEYESFARDAHRPLAPSDFSPRCPGSPELAHHVAPRVSFPRGGERFLRDAGGPGRQEILLEAQSDAARLRFLVDGRELGVARAPFRMPWALSAGAHELRVATLDGELSEAVTFEVR